jgi:hypothetical protein
MGDCFAYACAKANRATLLKGDDFTKTDIARPSETVRSRSGRQPHQALRRKRAATSPTSAP